MRGSYKFRLSPPKSHTFQPRRLFQPFKIGFLMFLTPLPCLKICDPTLGQPKPKSPPWVSQDFFDPFVPQMQLISSPPPTQDPQISLLFQPLQDGHKTQVTHISSSPAHIKPDIQSPPPLVAPLMCHTTLVVTRSPPIKSPL